MSDFDYGSHTKRNDMESGQTLKSFSRYRFPTLKRPKVAISRVRRNRAEYENNGQHSFENDS